MKRAPGCIVCPSCGGRADCDPEGKAAAASQPEAPADMRCIETQQEEDGNPGKKRAGSDAVSG